MFIYYFFWKESWIKKLRFINDLESKVWDSNPSLFTSRLRFYHGRLNEAK